MTAIYFAVRRFLARTGMWPLFPRNPKAGQRVTVAPDRMYVWIENGGGWRKIRSGHIHSSNTIKEASRSGYPYLWRWMYN